MSTETMNELSRVQRSLKAPKDQVNGFGKYKYRKAEDILQAVKPHLETLSLVMSDDIEVIGNRFFLKATASLCNNEGAPVATTHAFAELDEHKGMSKEQAIGSASSYARKYALCGLLAIDDSTDDPDTMAAPTQTPAQQPKQSAPAQAPKPAMSYAEITEAVKNAQSVEQLTQIWNDNLTAISTNTTLRELFTARKKVIQATNL